jgi:PKD repeat protein
VANFTHLNGTIGGLGNLTSSGNYVWSGGTESGLGTSTFNGPLLINGSVTLSQRTLWPMTAALQTNGSLSLSTAATLNIPSNVVYSIGDDSSQFGGGGTIYNWGTLVKSGASNNVSLAGNGISRLDGTVINSNKVESAAGTLLLDGPGFCFGNLQADAGARVEVDSPGFTWVGSLVSGGGTVAVTGGTLTLSNNVNATVANFTHLNGTIGGLGNLTSSGNYVWSGGTESGLGTNFDNGGLKVSGGVTLSQRTICSAASDIFTNGSISGGSGAVFKNLPGGKISIDDDFSMFGASASLQNQGIIVKDGAGDNASSAGSGISRIDWGVANTGTFMAQTGTLSFTASYLQTSGFTVLTGGVISASVPLNIQGGSLIGSGTIVGSLTNNGTASPGFSGAGTLSVSGNLTCQPSSVIKVKLGGTTQGTGYDFISVTNAVVLGGTLQIWFSSGFQTAIPPGAVFTILLAGGSLTNGFSNVGSGGRLFTADGYGSFIVTYSPGSKTVVLSGFTPNPVLTADFSANPTNGLAPLTVTFVNLTSGGATSFLWDFGDGTGSAAASPVHTYTNAGTYSVTLTASAPGATNSITKTNLITVTTVCTPTTAGLVGWWPAEGNANDSSGNSNNGTLQGGVTFAAGEVSQAFRFDGSGSVVVADSSSLDVSNQFTMDAWINPAALQTDPAQGAIISKVGGANGNNGYQFGMTGSNSQLYVIFNAPGEIWPANKLLVTLASPIPTNAWTHVAATYDHTNLNLYVNGVLVGSLLVGPKSVIDSASNLRISADDNGNVYFKGLIDEPDVFNRALSQTEIQAIVNAGSAGKCQVTGCTLTCPADVIVTNAPGQCGAVVNFAAPAASGSCGPVTCNPTNGSFFPMGTTVVSCTTTGAAKCVFNVTVLDKENPTITCPTNRVLSTSPGLCARTNVTYVVTFGDNCPGAVLMQTAGLPSGSTFPKGTTTNTFVVTDASGNTNTCSFTVTIIDTQLPTITCPTNMVLSTSPGLCVRTNVTYAVTFGDNCPGALLMQTAGLPSGSTFPKGTTTNTFVVTDASGNTNTCSFTVTIVDTEPPSITCPSNIVANAAVGAASVAVNYPAPIASDNCPGVNASCAPPSGSLFPVGVTMVTCIATDAAGNSNSCVFTVKVIASNTNTPPTISCPGNIITNAAPGQWGRTLAFSPMVSGAPTPTVTCKLGSNVITSPYDFPVGTNIVTCTATNLAGAANCAFTIGVIDTEPPVMTCPTNITVAAPMGQLGTIVNFIVSAVDNCDGPVAVKCTPPSGYFAVGQTPVICEAVDRSGNRAQCVFIITVTPTADDSPCAFTQGFYGNSKGKFNGSSSSVVVFNLLTQEPLLVGKLGVRSLTIHAGDVASLERLLPSGGPPAVLPDKGDQTLATASLPVNRKGRLVNILLGQTITLSLNVQLSAALLSFQLTSNFCTEGVLAGPDGMKGTPDDVLVTNDIQTFSIPASVLAALVDPVLGISDSTVRGLLRLANCALAGLPTGAATLGEITAALDAINRGFDGCRVLVICSAGPINRDADNDDFNNRGLLDPPPPPNPLLNVRVRKSNLTATKQPGEPDIAGNPGGKSVWWRWPVPVSGPVTVSTIGSSFDTLLGVYTGTTISNLVLLASNDDAEGTVQSDVTFQAVAGTEYQIAVDGFDGASGEIVLTLVAAPPYFCEPITVVGNHLSFCLTGELGRAYTVQATPDFVNWTLIYTFVNTNGSVNFTDPVLTNFLRRFYQLNFEPGP